MNDASSRIFSVQSATHDKTVKTGRLALPCEKGKYDRSLVMLTSSYFEDLVRTIAASLFASGSQNQRTESQTGKEILSDSSFST